MGRNANLEELKFEKMNTRKMETWKNGNLLNRFSENANLEKYKVGKLEIRKNGNRVKGYFENWTLGKII